MPNGETTDVLYIRCSDGRTRRHESIFDRCTHQVRVPGGVLDADYMEMTFGEELPEGVHERQLMHRIKTMMGLKVPKQVILASHAHCGAAEALGYSHQKVVSIHHKWAEKIRKLYPEAEVTVIHEKNSECGFHREWEIPEKVRQVA
jgi:carbonic anhydrase